MPIPVLLITGYLGAGKTTVLNHLLRSPTVRDSRPSLVINEFGSLGVDGHLVPPDTPRFEINQGSLFCACTKAQWVDALRRIAADDRSRMVLVESTGIAETRNLEGDLAIPALTEAFRILATLCVVDAAGFTRVAPFLRLVQDQVRWADGLVVNKVDRAGAAELDRLCEVLRALNPEAPQTRVSHGRVPEDFWSGLRHAPRSAAPVERPPAEIVAVAVRSGGRVSRRAFADLVARLDRSLLRLKGNILFDDGAQRFVEVVCGETIEGRANPSLGGPTAFTAIGWRISREDLAQEFNTLLRPEH